MVIFLFWVSDEGMQSTFSIILHLINLQPKTKNKNWMSTPIKCKTLPHIFHKFFPLQIFSPKSSPMFV